jgi:acyl-CoA reductase-like NAD-dependent aldehyde dehydrogenase
VCPLDGLPKAPVPVTGPDELRRQVAAARSAHDGWARRSLEDRARALERAARAMLDQRRVVIDLVRVEMGKLEVDALFTEGLGPLDTVKGWTRVVKQATARERVRLNPLAFPGKRAFIDMVPRGVVGVIAPWNFPVAGLYRSVLPALLTGNGVVVKPSEHTPRSSAWFVERLQQELPPGLVSCAQGGAETGEALIDAEIDALVFTGSTATGRKVSVACAERGIPCSAEMGGNDAAVILPDADLERTAAGLTQWALQNTGQACGAIEVAYLDQKIADPLVRKLARAWSRLRVGPGPMAEVDVSPVAHAAQLEKVEAHVEDAVKKGAKVLSGGRRHPEGLWYEPTLLDHCTDDMDVVREETFGPVLAICRVEGPTEAIRRINRGAYGLTCSLWTSDLARAERLADRIDVGVVTINNHAMTGAIPDLPWTGTRASGFGVANSRHALSTFVRPRTLLVDGSKTPEPFWLPYDPSTWRLGDLLADAQLGRVERAWQLPLLLRERVKKVKAFFE